uniref:Ubiquinol oxidase n=1 Tax=Mantoniella antarctica TaxID=81844 RepID=A0A7S0SJB7_9CHLO
MAFSSRDRDDDADVKDAHAPSEGLEAGSTGKPGRPGYMPAEATRAGSFPALAARNFQREFESLITDIFRSLSIPTGSTKQSQRLAEDAGEVPSTPEMSEMPECFGFTLSNEAILRYDLSHPPPGPVPVPAPIQLLYTILLFFVDRLYEGKAIERFWFLETVARMPYFAYTTCLHLYETMGWYRAAELRRVHFAEEWNELHHLLIMESMGGDKRWRDRFLGQHAAVFYYWVLVVVFFVAPSWSYKFSEMLETHAVSTYGEFISENAEKLAKLPAPPIARAYYQEGDLYMFDADSDLVRNAVGGDPRRAPCETLLDVFRNILADELEHVKTMALCQDYDSLEKLVSAGGSGRQSKSTSELLDPESRRKWTAWANDVNRDYGDPFLNVKP